MTHTTTQLICSQTKLIQGWMNVVCMHLSGWPGVDGTSD
tara:strand:- start:440 stop:556 length:117 start_codon:yes stop_codon:yes gene_type:complete